MKTTTTIILTYIHTYIHTHIHTQECCEQYWTGAGGNTPQDTNYTATCLPSRKLSKLDKPDMQDTAGEARTSSEVIYSNGPPHMAKQKQDDQLEHTYSSYVRISVLAAWHDDDDDDDEVVHTLWVIKKDPFFRSHFVWETLRQQVVARNKSRRLTTNEMKKKERKKGKKTQSGKKKNRGIGMFFCFFFSLLGLIAV